MSLVGVIVANSTGILSESLITRPSDWEHWHRHWHAWQVPPVLVRTGVLQSIVGSLRSGKDVLAFLDSSVSIDETILKNEDLQCGQQRDHIELA